MSMMDRRHLLGAMILIVGVLLLGFLFEAASHRKAVQHTIQAVNEVRVPVECVCPPEARLMLLQGTWVTCRDESTQIWQWPQHCDGPLERWRVGKNQPTVQP